jgi:hypothetical protein
MFTGERSDRADMPTSRWASDKTSPQTGRPSRVHPRRRTGRQAGPPRLNGDEPDAPGDGGANVYLRDRVKHPTRTWCRTAAEHPWPRTAVRSLLVRRTSRASPRLRSRARKGRRRERGPAGPQRPRRHPPARRRRSLHVGGTRHHFAASGRRPQRAAARRRRVAVARGPQSGVKDNTAFAGDFSIEAETTWPQRSVSRKSV